MSVAILTTLAFALYLASAVGHGAYLFLRAPAAPSGQAPSGSQAARLARPLLLLGIAVHFAAIGAWCVTTHRSPFASEYGTLSVFAWTIALAFAAVDFRVRLPAVGAVALLVACLALAWGVAHARAPIAATPLLKNGLVTLHVMAILVSFALFALAFGCAAFYVLQNRLLKARKVTGLFRRLPPLETLDSVAYHSVAYALPLLTIGLAVGMALVFGGGLARPAGAWLTDPHNLAAIVTWFLYLFYLLARLVTGWRGVRLQYILIVGLVVTLALYFVPSSTHQFS
ncbi:MAG TPA: cytochrome c biogenesis protein CcsA [Chthonomonadaceae bacterium]|nr:cytochrome c biogenesis protein CcsA [Chthonomonadaceae bacterium]